MEAAIRTVCEVVTGKPIPHLEVKAVRGLEGVREAVVEMVPQPGGILSNSDGENQDPIQLRVAVVNGLGNTKKIVQQVKEGKSPYHFIEVMACPGGECSKMCRLRVLASRRSFSSGNFCPTTCGSKCDSGFPSALT